MAVTPAPAPTSTLAAPLAANTDPPISGQTHIIVRGARTHNLKNLDLNIPRNQLVVITGLSGSGKSSLAFDTLYAEGQRRYVESLSAYARQFLQQMDKPDVDVIAGLSPAIAIEQKATSHNPRSTVGTVTEIHDYLRLLYARVGVPWCPTHHEPLQARTISQMVDAILALPQDTRIMVMAPIVINRKGEFATLFSALQGKGFVRFWVDQAVVTVDALPPLKKTIQHTIAVVIDRLRVTPDMQQRLAESLESALRLQREIADTAAQCLGRVLIQEMDSPTQHSFNSRFACPRCNFSLTELAPRLFSFNAPAGACPDCDGLGQTEVFDSERVVSAPQLSLAAGAIRGWDARNDEYHQLLCSVAQHYGFSVQTPFCALSKRHQDIVLHGCGEDALTFMRTPNAGQHVGQTLLRQQPFEGVLPNLMRRYRATESAAVREELAKYRSTQVCQTCQGTRLRAEARCVRVGDAGQERTLPEVSALPLHAALHWFEHLQLSGSRAAIAQRLVHEIVQRLRFLCDVGLGYLSLSRSAQTLSGGESQRIRLASQIGSGLTGVMYVLDEPSIGLHQRDNNRLIATLLRLRDLGNSVLVVEHDEDMIRAADYVIDLGPGAGVHGGALMAAGSAALVAQTRASLTGQYLSGQRRIALPSKRLQPKPAVPLPAQALPARTAARAGLAHQHMQAQAADKTGGWLHILGASGNNLKNVDVAIPVGLFTCVTGVSGSGKSTLINDTLYAAAATALHRSEQRSAAHRSIEGLSHFDKVINVSQSPIGRTPRSNPATYTGLFTPLRELMAEVPQARERGYGAGRFSFNVAGGRCEACQGDGVLRVEMHFLPDVYVPCDVCQGQRYNRETLDIQYRGKNIAHILELTMEEAYAFFQAVPTLARKLQTLLDVGLGYLRLGQSATTLSGGEAQRVKLALELSKRDTGRTLYILDEPTTGLHFADIALLLQVLLKLRDAGNTIVVIEHNLDVIKTADWVVDMGPEGGAQGGQVLASGPPETIAACAHSHTGRYLASYLAQHTPIAESGDASLLRLATAAKLAAPEQAGTSSVQHQALSKRAVRVQTAQKHVHAQKREQRDE